MPMDVSRPPTLHAVRAVARLEEGWRERLEYQLKADCALLESCHVSRGDGAALQGLGFRVWV